VAKLEDIASRPGANEKSRGSVLLANADQEQTLTITHVLWAMFGVLPAVRSSVRTGTSRWRWI